MASSLVSAPAICTTNTSSWPALRHWVRATGCGAADVRGFRYCTPGRPKRSCGKSVELLTLTCPTTPWAPMIDPISTKSSMDPSYTTHTLAPAPSLSPYRSRNEASLSRVLCRPSRSLANSGRLLRRCCCSSSSSSSPESPSLSPFLLLLDGTMSIVSAASWVQLSVEGPAGKCGACVWSGRHVDGGGTDLVCWIGSTGGGSDAARQRGSFVASLTDAQPSGDDWPSDKEAAAAARRLSAASDSNAGIPCSQNTKNQGMPWMKSRESASSSQLSADPAHSPSASDVWQSARISGRRKLMPFWKVRQVTAHEVVALGNSLTLVRQSAIRATAVRWLVSSVTRLHRTMGHKASSSRTSTVDAKLTKHMHGRKSSIDSRESSCSSPRERMGAFLGKYASRKPGLHSRKTCSTELNDA
mmetsp:Transcript_6073/g.17327  ORF Transcript_6073/g.17327 Transcript_6073/m.17327 type:complete len:414 (+) Transcript_6073:2652-3893(+)